ncbi:MAG: Excisionase [Chthonomonadaceae bacterium]|nr:Excisionase [Chthonomonadaceae bacterium]
MSKDKSKLSASSYMSAAEVAEELEISLPTLYSYVSRGLLRSEFADPGRRTRRYHAEDVQRLKARQEMRRDPQKVVDTALHWGTPMLPSAVTLIEAGRFYYRGQDVLELACDRSVEQVAALLWTGDVGKADTLFAQTLLPVPPPIEAITHLLREVTPMERCQALLPLLASDDLAAYDFRPEPMALTSARILRRMTLVATGQDHFLEAEGIAALLQRVLVPHQPQALRLLNAVLILCADHELNVSSFTARCVASAGSPPFAVVSGGLAALQGGKHGGMSARVEALFREAVSPQQARSSIAQRIRRGEPVPGFGHPLYPEGDPRGRLLLELVGVAYPQSAGAALAQALTEAAKSASLESPNIDFALATLCSALEQPPGSAIMLFALGRTIGWLGHAMEQYQADQLIRPRAHYTGILPTKTELERKELH